MNATKQVEVCEKLEFLKPTLTSWVDRIEQVSRFFPQSKGRYYLEPTLVGLLAGSAWTNEIRAITEVKIKRTGPERGGRLDLLMHSGDHRIALEAKLIWGSDWIPGNVMKTLRHACEEVISVSAGTADVMLGAVFFVPWWNHEGQRRALLAKVLPRYGDLRADVKACYYDPDIEYPGAILIAQMAETL